MSTAPHTPDTYDRLIDDLTYAYDGVFSPETIATVVHEARALLEPRATITQYLPIFVAKQAREQLMTVAQAEGRVAKQVPEILFVCVHNAGRSQMAAALLDHHAAGRVHVRSAGSTPSDALHPRAVEVMREIGIDLGSAFPKPLTDDVVRAADVVITMGCGDTCPIFPGKRYEDWTLDDPAGQGVEAVRPIRDNIRARVSELLDSLGIETVEASS